MTHLLVESINKNRNMAKTARAHALISGVLGSLLETVLSPSTFEHATPDPPPKYRNVL